MKQYNELKRLRISYTDKYLPLWVSVAMRGLGYHFVAKELGVSVAKIHLWLNGTLPISRKRTKQLQKLIKDTLNLRFKIK